MKPLPFLIKTNYQRAKIHEDYGGQRMSGISTPAEGEFIFLFAQNHNSSNASLRCGYKDGWTKNRDTFNFTASGQKGDQTLSGPNKALATHAQNRKRLLLFTYSGRSGYWLFEGEFEYAGFYKDIGPDATGLDREVIVFTLRPLTPPIQPDQLGDEWRKSSLKSSLNSPSRLEYPDASLKSSGYHFSPPNSPLHNSSLVPFNNQAEPSRKREREEQEVPMPNQPPKRKIRLIPSNKTQFMKIMNATNDKQTLVGAVSPPLAPTTATTTTPKPPTKPKKFDLDDLLGSMEKHMDDVFVKP